MSTSRNQKASSDVEVQAEHCRRQINAAREMYPETFPDDAKVIKRGGGGLKD